MKLRGTRLRVALGACALVALALALAALRRGLPSSSAGAPPPRTARVERRDFVRVLRLHGVVEAARFQTIAAPRLARSDSFALVITRLAKPGTRVQPGDVLAEFDRQGQLRTFLDRQAEYRDLVEQIKKKQAEQTAARAADTTQLRSAENAVQIAALETKRNEVISRIDAEKNEQNLEEAKARLSQLRETQKTRESVRFAELRVLEIRRDRAERAMEHAERNSQRMLMRSPIEGVVVLNSIWKGSEMAEVQEGDEIRPGVPFLQVVDPQAMRVRSRVNQVDALTLRAGMPARIRLDAYPDVELPGRLEQATAIGTASDMSERVRTFVATFMVQGADARLMPDLSAAVDVELERQKDVLVVPRDALVVDRDRTLLRVVGALGTGEVAVAVAARSDHEAVVSRVSEGAVVLRGGRAQQRGRP
jgi:HlyD family secretion protein